MVSLFQHLLTDMILDQLEGTIILPPTRTSVYASSLPNSRAEIDIHSLIGNQLEIPASDSETPIPSQQIGHTLSPAPDSLSQLTGAGSSPRLTAGSARPTHLLPPPGIVKPTLHLAAGTPPSAQPQQSINDHDQENQDETCSVRPSTNLSQHRSLLTSQINTHTTQSSETIIPKTQRSSMAKGLFSSPAVPVAPPSQRVGTNGLSSAPSQRAPRSLNRAKRPLTASHSGIASHHGTAGHPKEFRPYMGDEFDPPLHSDQSDPSPAENTIRVRSHPVQKKRVRATAQIAHALDDELLFQGLRMKGAGAAWMKTGIAAKKRGE